MGKSDAVFKKIEAGIDQFGEKLVSQAKATFCFKIKDGDEWLLDLKSGKGSLKKGGGKADCTITIGDADFMALSEGKLNGMQAFMSGKMKIAGNMMLAQKLQGLFKQFQ